MGNKKIKNILWTIAIILIAISLLGHYHIVFIKGISSYSYELLLIISVALLLFSKK